MPNKDDPLEVFISEFLSERDWKWKVKGHPEGVSPTDSDIAAALDEAARMLYNEQVGTTLQVGRLVIVKEHSGYDVYVMAGSYN